MNNRAWDEEINEIMRKEVSEMTYDELVKLTMEFKDEEELERWSDAGDDEYDRLSTEHEEKYGIAYPIYEDSPQKVKDAYERLSKMELEAAETGTILY